jgi:CTP synthase (UTP-ammonia lyase)
MPPNVALIGDYSAAVPAHRAIPRALELARQALGVALEWEWLPTRDIRDAPRDLARFAAIWLVPASPYENMQGALAAIRFARETKRPFLGTCGGFQHALIEFARNVGGLATADHAETNPTGDILIVAPLTCSLVEKTGNVRFTAGSRLREIYGRDTAHEGYHCSYGVNSAHRAALERSGLTFTAFDDAGDIRGTELSPAAHPFFIATLFQPERAALLGELPPVVRAFISAITNQSPRGERL